MTNPRLDRRGLRCGASGGLVRGKILAKSRWQVSSGYIVSLYCGVSPDLGEYVPEEHIGKGSVASAANPRIRVQAPLTKREQRDSSRS